MSRKLSFVFAAFAAAAMFGMGSASSGGFANDAPTLQSTPLVILAAQKGRTGGRGLSFSCEGLQCTCQGVEDCNDMFTSGKCGDIASCDDDTDICKCLMFKKNPVKTPHKGKTPTVKVQ